MMHSSEERTPALNRGWTRAHWFHLFMAILATTIYLAGGIAQSRLASLPPDFDASTLKFPVEMGDHVVGTIEELAARIGGEAIGQPLQIQELDGEVDRVILPYRAVAPIGDIVTKLNGLFFLAVTVLVFAPRIDKVPARDLFWACLLYGLAVMIGGVHVPQGTTWPGATLPLLRITSLVALPTLMLHVGLTFPRRRSILDKLRWLMPVVTLVGLGLAAWHFGTWLRWLEGDGEWSSIAAARRMNALFLAAVFGAGCLGLVWGYRTTQSEHERVQVKWVLWGIAMGAAPFVFLHALPRALESDLVLPIWVARLFSMVIPIAFSLAVIRHKFLDVDIIIRRSLIYLTLASIIVGIYSLIGIVVGRQLARVYPELEPIVPIVATLIAAFLFTPTRRSIAFAIDRVFFKIRFSHNQALNVFMRELRGASDQQTAANILAAFLDKHLSLQKIAVALRRRDQSIISGDWPETLDPLLELPGGSSIVACPETTTRPSIERHNFPALLRERGFMVAHSISTEGNPLGTLALGEKQTSRRFVVEDIELLQAVVRETAMRVHRINLEEDYVDERVARQQVEEMGAFRTQFFSQFAHDLRSPLTSINWGARNLLDGVVGPVSDDQREYLEGIEASARQLVRLVNNLLEVTRLESGTPDVEFALVDLAQVVRESVSKLRATANVRGVTLTLRVPSEVELMSHSEKLLEIIDNLVENAIRYSPPNSEIVVALVPSEASVRLEVTDQGPGIDPEQQEAIFEPYRQGTPSPYSSQQGFGLGLFVVRSWVDRMEGQVAVESPEAGGTRFVVEFPVNSNDRSEESQT